jgi:DNA sulfur modification protein DndB
MPNTRTLFPSLRAQMGDWWYYITTMTFGQVKSWILKVDDIHERTELKTWIQRDIREERLEQISDYLKSQKQHFFNSIVVGIYGGDPDWYPITIGKNPTLPDLQIEDRAKHTFGFLCLTGSEEVFAVDGQHRVEGIKKALSQRNSLARDQQCVIFISHKQTEKGRARTRRLFSTLNKYAKPVSKGELVALSEDDTFAIVTRKMIDDYKHLNITFVPLTKTANIPTSDTRCVTTVLALYDLIRTISLPPRSREKRRLEVGPPRKQRIQEIYDLACNFWDLLRKNVPEIKRVTDSQPDDSVAHAFRTKQGGHVLFRPVGMKAFCMAARILVNRGETFEDAVALLGRTTLNLASVPWQGVLWNTVAQTVINKNGKLAYNLFLYMTSEPLEPNNYDLLGEYRKALDKNDADLREIVKIT